MRYTINDMKFKRRRLGLTNYKRRLALVKGNMDRVVVRKTNKRIIGQVVSYEEKGDKSRHAPTRTTSSRPTDGRAGPTGRLRT